MSRVLVVCPGRGSYSRDTLGSLRDRTPEAQAIVAACDAWRTEQGRPTVSALDAADRFSSVRHQQGENASLLTFACSLADLADLHEGHTVAGITGNSMGWYTALAASGALSLHDAIRLVDTMGCYQEGAIIGGQILTPLTGTDWQPDPARRAALDQVLAQARAAGHDAYWSIDLGSFAVLAGDEAGIQFLLSHLPSETRGSVTFPNRLPKHAAFHTPLMQATSARAQRELADLTFHAPRVPLVDGQGRVHRPHWADPEALRAYTLGHQVVAPYDYGLALRAALHHTAPDLVALLGPGNSLGGPSAAVLVQDGWRGLSTRDAFTQAAEPLLLSWGVPHQRTALTSAPPQAR